SDQCNSSLRYSYRDECPRHREHRRNVCLLRMSAFFVTAGREPCPRIALIPLSPFCQEGQFLLVRDAIPARFPSHGAPLDARAGDVSRAEGSPCQLAARAAFNLSIALRPLVSDCGSSQKKGQPGRSDSV